ncbi:MAG: hypothetical protein J1F16_01015 [Muribaculaceae bacterium]|nr:hypothetical protein [Muribaculaceae bacterium]
MNISPILLLTIGATFAVLYGLIITIGWSITRKNRKKYHLAIGLYEIELYDLKNGKPLNKFVNSFSLSKNSFLDVNGKKINPENHKCFIVENESPELPQIKKGFIIFMNPETNRIEYAFDVPNLHKYR